MYRAGVLCFVLCTSLALSKSLKKVACSLTDDKCVSDGSKLIFPLIVEGIPGKIPSSDPIHLDTINLAISNSELTLNDATLIGFKKCQLQYLLIRPKERYVEYEIECPRIGIEATSYSINGKFGDAIIKGSGPLKITYDNFNMKFLNEYIKNKDESGNEYSYVTKYTLTLNPAAVNPEITGLSFDDKENDENLVKFEEASREPLLRQFFDKHLIYLNQYLALIPLDQLYHKNVEE